MNPELEKLIELAANGGTITDRQKEIIKKKAISLGEDPDEAEMILELTAHKKSKIKADNNTPAYAEDVFTDLPPTNHKTNIPSFKEKRQKQLYRKKEGKILLGACAGFAEYFKINPWVLRIILGVIELVILFLSIEYYIGSLWPIVLPLLYVFTYRIPQSE